MMMMLVTKKMVDAGITHIDYYGNLSYLLHVAEKHNDILFMAVGEKLRQGTAQRSLFFLAGPVQNKPGHAELDRHEFSRLPGFFQNMIVGFIKGVTNDICMSR